MQRRASLGCGRRRRGETTRRDVASVLVFLACAKFILQASAETTTITIPTSSPPPSTPQRTSAAGLPIGTTSRGTVNPGPTTSSPTSPVPKDSPTSLFQPTVSTPTPRLPTTSSPTTIGSSKSYATINSVTTLSTIKTSSQLPITPARFWTRTSIPTAETAFVSPAQEGNQTEESDVVTTSGSSTGLATVPPPLTTIVFETTFLDVTESPPAETTGGELEGTEDYATLNATSAISGDSGLNPDHEREELKKLLAIIGGSIGASLVAILIVFAVVYHVAKRRRKRNSSRYYNFKKKKSNYEKVLHLQEYYGELDTDTSSAGTGAAWVFQENDPDAGKTITLELDPKDREKPAGRSGKKKSKNKNKNNRNKGAGRGNYQVLAEIFPTKNSPPDVLLTVDGAVQSTSEDEEGAILDTSFGPVILSDDKSDEGPDLTDRLASRNSFNEGARSSWPTWNTSPYVTVTSEDAVVEL